MKDLRVCVALTHAVTTHMALPQSNGAADGNAVSRNALPEEPFLSDNMYGRKNAGTGCSAPSMRGTLSTLSAE